jgi:hypothetical protein
VLVTAPRRRDGTTVGVDQSDAPAALHDADLGDTAAERDAAEPRDARRGHREQQFVILAARRGAEARRRPRANARKER